jgi:hypothetical protein
MLFALAGFRPIKKSGPAGPLLSSADTETRAVVRYLIRLGGACKLSADSASSGIAEDSVMTLTGWSSFCVMVASYALYGDAG